MDFSTTVSTKNQRLINSLNLTESSVEEFEFPVDLDYSVKKDDLLALIHHTRIPTESIKYSEIHENNRAIQFMNLTRPDQNSVQELKFVKITCDSIFEAQKRAYIFGCVSYSFRSKQFLKLFTKSHLEDGFFLCSIRSSLNYY